MIVAINLSHHFIVICETFYLNKVSWVFARILDRVKNPYVQLSVNYIIHEISKQENEVNSEEIKMKLIEIHVDF